jgi:hypothetical protein
LQQGLSFAAGEVGQAFSFDGASSYISVAASPSLDVGVGGAFTIECWIYPTDISSLHIMSEWNNGLGGLGVHFYHSDPGIGGLGALGANVVDVDNGIISGFGSIGDRAERISTCRPDIDRGTGIGKLYHNGVAVVAQDRARFCANELWTLF